MTAGLHTALIPGINRPVVIGEYPYYRAAPDSWADNLRALRALGVDVVSCYLPWRFHEVGTAPQQLFDFRGKTDPQRDVIALIQLAAEAGLAVFLKPGPFIHAEVQLGGLPDRLCVPGHAAYRGLNGAVLRSQAKPLPSLADPTVKAEVERWLRAVVMEVVAPAAAPHGPVVALQLGNEGTCGDAHIAIDAQDASPAVREEFARWLTAQGYVDEAGRVADELGVWSTSLRLLWSRFSGTAIVNVWDWISELLPPGPVRLANVPLARADGRHAAVDAWAARQRAIKVSRHWTGHTEWVGNPARDQTAFGTHLTQIMLGDSDVLEANWGFTWDDESFAGSSSAMFNALLSLMLGSTTVSVYTACATGHWGDLVDMDPDGLRADGVDPALHTPPYCPGAPLAESGVHNPSAQGLRRLTRFLGQHGSAFIGSHLEYDARLLVDRTFAESGAWQRQGPTVLQELTVAVPDELRRSSRLIGLGWLDEQPHLSTEADGSPVGVLRVGVSDGHPQPNLLALPAGTPAGGAVAAFVAGLAAGAPRWTSEGKRGVALTRRNPDRTRLLGLFNPTGEPDRIAAVGNDWAVDLPAGTAAVVVTRAGTPVGAVVTPAADASSDVAVEWHGERVDLSRLSTSS